MTTVEFREPLYLVIRTRWFFGLGRSIRVCELPYGREMDVARWAQDLALLGPEVHWRVENRFGQPQKGYGFE